MGKLLQFLALTVSQITLLDGQRPEHFEASEPLKDILQGWAVAVPNLNHSLLKVLGVRSTRAYLSVLEGQPLSQAWLMLRSVLTKYRVIALNAGTAIIVLPQKNIMKNHHLCKVDSGENLPGRAG